jgi:hypothetical protein
MKYFKDRPVGIWIFPVIIIIFNLYYYHPLYTGTWEHIESILSFSKWAFFVWTDITLSIIAIFAVTYGFYKAKNLARLYMIGYLLLSSFWAIISMYVIHWQVYEHYLYLVVYTILIMYLMMSNVKEYFKKQSRFPEHTQKKSDIYRYGNYILHKKELKSKSGAIRNLYFFSKEESGKGEPCSMPKGYTLGVNKTGLPYLKKNLNN